MPNAKDQTVLNRNVLAVGLGGAGKTAQIVTFEPPVFAYFFDSHALDTVQGFDIDYEEFLPDDLAVGIWSLNKKKNEDLKAERAKRDKKHANRNSEVYRAFEKHFEDAYDTGDFEGVNTIVIDSLTMFGDLVMDEVLRINGRPGQWPQQDDYGPAINGIRNFFRKLTSMKKQVYVCAHANLIEDELSHKVFYQLMMFGQLRNKLPLMFGHILPMHAEAVKGEVKYTCQTKPDRQWNMVRTTMRDAPFMADVGIDWTKDPVGQGLGGLLSRFQAAGNRPSKSAAKVA